MDRSIYTVNEIFDHLGLASDGNSIRHFVQVHQQDKSESMLALECWTDEQRAFIEEALGADTDWCKLIDQLESRLSH